nr:hypothetical protein [Sorangium sp. Soce836]
MGRDRPGQRGDRAEPPLRFLLEAAEDRRLEIFRDVVAERSRRDRLPVHDRRGGLEEAPSLERHPRGEQLIQHDAERPDVDARVDRPRRAELLRRHVQRRAEHDIRAGDEAVAGRPRRRDDLGDAEIKHLEAHGAVAPARHEEVLGLEIAVDDPERVRLADRLARIEYVADRLADRERTTFAQERAQIHAFQVLHHDERSAGLEEIHVEDADDVIAREPRGGARLAKKTLDRVGALGQPRVKELDRDGLFEAKVPGGDDDAHAACAEDTLEPVFPPDDLPALEREHGKRSRPRA